MHFYSIRKYRIAASPFKAVQHLVESCPDMYMPQSKKPTKYLNLNINITKIHNKEQQVNLIKQFPKLCINLIIYYFTVIFNIKASLYEAVFDDFQSNTLPGCL